MYDLKYARELAKENVERCKWFLKDDVSLEKALSYCEENFAKPAHAAERTFYERCLRLELLRRGYKPSTPASEE